MNTDEHGREEQVKRAPAETQGRREDVVIIGINGSEDNRRGIAELEARGVTVRELSMDSRGGEFAWEIYTDGQLLEPPIFVWVKKAKGFCNVDTLVEAMGIEESRADE